MKKVKENNAEIPSMSICLPFRSIWSPFLQIRVQELPKELVLEIFQYLTEPEIFHSIYYVSKTMYEVCQTDYFWKILTVRKFKNLKYLYTSEPELMKIYASKNRSWKKVYFHLLYHSFSLIKIVCGSYACLASETTTVWITCKRKLCFFHGKISTDHGRRDDPKDSRNFDILDWLENPQGGSCVIPVDRVFRLVDAIMSESISEEKLRVEDVIDYFVSSNSEFMNHYYFFKNENEELMLDYFKDRFFRYEIQQGGFLAHPIAVTLYTRRDLKFFERKVHGNKEFSGYVPWHFQSKNEDEKEDRFAFQRLRGMKVTYNFEISKALLKIFHGKMSNYRLLRGLRFLDHFRYYKSFVKREKERKEKNTNIDEID